MRIRWWDDQARTYRALALMPKDELRKLPEDPVPTGANYGYAGTKPLFFGHYWLEGQPSPVSGRAACVDYSVAKEGKLVAYRFAAGEPLSSQNFTWVGA